MKMILLVALSVGLMEDVFCLSRGLYDIFVTRDNQSRCVGRYDNHGSFGELALMYNTPRAATIVATTEGSLWGLVSMGTCSLQC